MYRDIRPRRFHDRNESRTGIYSKSETRKKSIRTSWDNRKLPSSKMQSSIEPDLLAELAISGNSKQDARYILTRFPRREIHFVSL